MSETATSSAHTFADRRDPELLPMPPGVERRQFANTHDRLAPPVREIAFAIDEYKVRHRRRFVTFDELYHVISELGYRQQSTPVG